MILIILGVSVFDGVYVLEVQKYTRTRGLPRARRSFHRYLKPLWNDNVLSHFDVVQTHLYPFSIRWYNGNFII